MDRETIDEIKRLQARIEKLEERIKAIETRVDVLEGWSKYLDE